MDNAAAALVALEIDMLAHTAGETATAFTLYMNSEAWMIAQ